jgi:hypothetical protein
MYQPANSEYSLLLKINDVYITSNGWARCGTGIILCPFQNAMKLGKTLDTAYDLKHENDTIKQLGSCECHVRKVSCVDAKQ